MGNILIKSHFLSARLNVNGFFAFINNELFGKHSFEYENEFLISIQLDCPATAEILDSGLIIIFSEDGSVVLGLRVHRL